MSNPTQTDAIRTVSKAELSVGRLSVPARLDVLRGAYPDANAYRLRDLARNA